MPLSIVEDLRLDTGMHKGMEVAAPHLRIDETDFRPTTCALTPVYQLSKEFREPHLVHHVLQLDQVLHHFNMARKKSD